MDMLSHTPSSNTSSDLVAVSLKSAEAVTKGDCGLETNNTLYRSLKDTYDPSALQAPAVLNNTMSILKPVLSR